MSSGSQEFSSNKFLNVKKRAIILINSFAIRENDFLHEINLAHNYYKDVASLEHVNGGSFKLGKRLVSIPAYTF